MCGVLCLILVLLFSTLCPSSFAIVLMDNRELVALLDFLHMSCDSLYSVALSHCAVCRSAVCDCGIS